MREQAQETFSKVKAKHHGTLNKIPCFLGFSHQEGEVILNTVDLEQHGFELRGSTWLGIFSPTVNTMALHDPRLVGPADAEDPL